MTLNTETIGYMSGAVTALCGLGLAALRGRDREKHRQAILLAKTPEQVAALDKLLPMLFRGAAFLVVAFGACLDASAPVVASRDARAADALVKARPATVSRPVPVDFTPDRRPEGLPVYQARR